ncbi:MAG: histidine triad nucleotide-binding protein [Thermovirga sp.]
MSGDCVFCRIVEGLQKADVVYSNEDVIVIRDIHPMAPVHLLVIPKAHVESSDGVDDPSLWSSLMGATVRVARDMGLSADGYRLVVNCGAEAGQTVFHLHVHLLSGRSFSWPPG